MPVGLNASHPASHWRWTPLSQLLKVKMLLTHHYWMACAHRSLQKRPSNRCISIDRWRLTTGSLLKCIYRGVVNRPLQDLFNGFSHYGRFHNDTHNRYWCDWYGLDG